MKVRFVFDADGGVEYGWGGLDERVPVEGERITADGSDPGFPAGEYVVGLVQWHVGLRGAHAATVYLSRPRSLNPPHGRPL